MCNLRKYFWVFLVLVNIPLIIYAQTMVFNGYHYKKQDGKWYQVENGVNYEVDSRVITVKFSANADSTEKAHLNHSFRAIVLRTNKLGFVDLQLPKGDNPIEQAENYSKSELVDIAMVNTYGEYLSTPNDPLYDDQWYLEAIDAPGAWDYETGDHSVILGILDSGTEYDHEDLWGNNWVNPAEDFNGNGVPDFYPYYAGGDLDSYDNDGNGKVDDLVGWDFYQGNNDVTGPNYHGTHVAGVAAARTNNSTGVAGIAGGWSTQKGVSLLIGGVGDSYPHASILDDAILYAADAGADVITMSLTVAASPAIIAAIESAHQDGVFIDCATGNEGSSSVTFPANAKYVMAVGATVQNGLRASFSNYGDSLDVMAPGVSIESTRLNDAYGSGSGTSFSAPQVAGIAALLLSVNSAFTPTKIEKIIACSAVKARTDVYDYNRNRRFGAWNNQMGYGLINAHYAVAPPAAPQNIAVTSGSGNHPYVTWNANSEPDLTGYYLYRKNANDVVTQLNINPVQSTHYLDTDMEVGWATEVWYFVKAVDVSNQLSSSSSEYHIWVIPSDKQIVQSIKPVLPADYGLSPNYPNPFNPLTEIHYQLPTQSQVLLTIYNLKGQQVKTLARQVQDAGFYSVLWDGTNESGEIVSAGTYLYVLVAFSQSSNQHYRSVHKMVYLK